MVNAKSYKYASTLDIE